MTTKNPPGADDTRGRPLSDRKYVASQEPSGLPREDGGLRFPEDHHSTSGERTTAVVTREGEVAAREETVGLREEAAGLREEAAGLREETSSHGEEAVRAREEAAGLREETTALDEEAVR